jgi:hypothetical protein
MVVMKAGCDDYYCKKKFGKIRYKIDKIDDLKFIKAHDNFKYKKKKKNKYMQIYDLIHFNLF